MDEADPRAKLEPFQALIGEWTIEMTHRCSKTRWFAGGPPTSGSKVAGS